MNIYRDRADLANNRVDAGVVVEIAYDGPNETLSGGKFLVKTAAQAALDGDVVDGINNIGLPNGNVAVRMFSYAEPSTVAGNVQFDRTGTNLISENVQDAVKELDAALTNVPNLDDYYDKDDTDNLLSLKADSSSVYTKSESDAQLDTKANAATTYSKTETDNLLVTKADLGVSYTKAENDSLLLGKADAVDTYSKTDVDNITALKADSNNVYTKAQSDAQLAAKSDVATTYNKTQTDALLDTKLDITAISGGLSFKGGWDASSGSAPPDPANIPDEAAEFYVITAAGTILTISYAVGDLIVWHTTNDEWFKVESTTQVNSVNGKTGTVTLVAGDVGAYTIAAVDGFLATKADASNVYSKSEIEAAFAQFYTKTVSDGRFLLKGEGAYSAAKLTTPRTISLSGGAAGSTVFDGSANVTIPVTVPDDSHNHIIANVDGLQSALDGKLPTGGTAAAATKLATARTLALSGGVTGSASFDGTANSTIVATVTPNSHDHTIANVSGLQSALDSKLATTGTAVASDKLATSRVIALAGHVSGSANFDGTANATITATVANNSHTHTAANISDLKSNAKRDVFISTAAPTSGDGVDGDIWYQYE